MLTTGMCFIAAAVVVAAWFVLKSMLANTMALSIVTILILAFLATIALVITLRPPVVLTLDPVGYRTRRDNGRWKDVQDVGLGDGILTFADASGNTVGIPLNVIDEKRHVALVEDVYERLNKAHGYQRFGTTD